MVHQSGLRLHQASYLITSRWAETLVDEADGIDDHTRHKAQFYLRQISGALSPSNFVMTNPELIRHTLKENGANLVRGMKMLAEDIEAGNGQLRVRQTDPSAGFEVGVNVAVTPGEVVFRNDLMELIQYAPTTETVLKRPFLIVPPWINKFYILDLNPAKSLIAWMVSQGLTVFCISWVNPDARHADKDFESYMREGIETAIDAIGVATGESEVAAAGYCVGGTLLAVTLAMQAATGNKRIKSATFLTTQVDFTHAGDLKVFADEDQIRLIESRMQKRGYLEGTGMATAFNMLRPNDLIWSYVVNNYVKGQKPMPFDLLYWNADATRMPPRITRSTCATATSTTPCPRQDDPRQRAPRPEEGEGAGLQSRHPRGPHRPGLVGLRGILEVRRPGRLRAGGLGPHRRRGEPARQTEIRLLDRRPGRGPLRGLGGRRHGDQGVLVAVLVPVAGASGPRARARPHPRRGGLTSLGPAPGTYVRMKA